MICKLARNCGVANFDETGERDGMGGGRSGLIWPFVEPVSEELELWGISSTKLSGKTPIWKA